MAGRTPHAAVRAFVEPFQKSLSCVSGAVFNVSRGGYDEKVGPHRLLLPDANPIPLEGAAQFALSVIVQYRIVQARGRRGPWKVDVTDYLYHLHDHTEAEVILYHWHPSLTPDNPHPHLHLEVGTRIGRKDLLGKHLPTGRVTFEEVLRFLITELHVQPRRPDWAAILDKNQSLFEAWRTWPTPAQPGDA